MLNFKWTTSIWKKLNAQWWKFQLSTFFFRNTFLIFEKKPTRPAWGPDLVKQWLFSILWFWCWKIHQIVEQKIFGIAWCTQFIKFYEWNFFAQLPISRQAFHRSRRTTENLNRIFLEFRQNKNYDCWRNFIENGEFRLDLHEFDTKFWKSDSKIFLTNFSPTLLRRSADGQPEHVWPAIPVNTLETWRKTWNFVFKFKIILKK